MGRKKEKLTEYKWEIKVKMGKSLQKGKIKPKIFMSSKFFYHRGKYNLGGGGVGIKYGFWTV